MNTNEPAIWIERKAFTAKIATGINTMTVEPADKTAMTPLYTGEQIEKLKEETQYWKTAFEKAMEIRTK